MTNGRPSQKSPGRTPPFILVGLLVLLCVLAYNYWTLSARNGELTAKTEKMASDAKTLSSAHTSVRQNLETAEEKLKSTESNLDQVRQLLKEKEGELHNLQSDMSKLQSEQNKCAEDLVKCDADIESKGQNLESAATEKRDLEEEIARLKSEAAAQPQTCELQQCQAPVRNIIAVFTKFVNPQTLRQALDSAQLDSNLIMGPPGNDPNANLPPNANNNLQPDGNIQPPQKAEGGIDNAQPVPGADSNTFIQNGGQPQDGELKVQNGDPPQVNPANSGIEAVGPVGKKETTLSSNPQNGTFSDSAKPLVFLSDEKEAVGEKQSGKDGEENELSLEEVVKQNIDDGGRKSTTEVTTTEATPGLESKEQAATDVKVEEREK